MPFDIKYDNRNTEERDTPPPCECATINRISAPGYFFSPILTKLAINSTLSITGRSSAREFFLLE